jgi:hypothetical protein
LESPALTPFGTLRIPEFHVWNNGHLHCEVFFNEEKRWLNRETVAKNGERLAEECREFFNNAAKKNGEKERGKKKCSLRDSHCSSCDRMRSAEANV